ncbi:MAG: NADPH-dependent F420 reductase [Alphaproteobacteria bacterium]|nr:NADPH-dependent F420 reductase [Alphaproteobacteria bacterium]
MKRRTALATSAALALTGGSTMAQSTDKTVAIIGTGRMGSAFGANFARIGYTVIYGSRNPGDAKVADVVKATKGSRAVGQKEAAAAANLVVVAAPWNGLEATVKGLGDLTGKIVLDPTNAISFGKDGGAMAVDSSAGELMQGWAPGAKVVKAFNTVGYFVIADPSQIEGRVACFLAANDADAKARASEIVTAMGFEAVDAGPIKNARVLEGMSTLYMVPYMSGKQDQRFEYAVRRTGHVKLGPVRTAG